MKLHRNKNSPDPFPTYKIYEGVDVIFAKKLYDLIVAYRYINYSSDYTINKRQKTHTFYDSKRAHPQDSLFSHL